MDWVVLPGLLMLAAKVKTSSGIPHISAKQIKEFKIILPCLAEQTKIANFLTAIDDKITHTKTKTQLDVVKLYKKGLLQKLFVSYSRSYTDTRKIKPFSGH